jgi:O-antigen ligase
MSTPASSKPLSRSNPRRFDGAVFWVFIALVCLTGGASRHDVLSLVVLRPLAVLAFCYAVVASQGGLRQQPLPFYLLLALGGLMLAQLVPLPPGTWEQLPGRDMVAQVEAAVGMPSPWRSLSLTPARTWNSFFALMIPLATFVLYSLQPQRIKQRVPLAIVACGVASMVWGLAQLVGGADTPLYHYRIHTDDRPIGLFANRNHQAMFLALSILFAGMMIETVLKAWSKSSPLYLTALGGYVVLVLVFEFILGSRGGLLLAGLAVAAVAVAVAMSPNLRRRRQPASRAKAQWWTRFQRPWVVLPAVAASLSVLVFMAVSLNRNEAFARMFVSGDTSRYDRLEILPYLATMLGDQFPWGSGFGSFDALFRRYESTDLLSTFYLNQAHNDWMQFLIEGGLPAAGLLAVFVGWCIHRMVRRMREGGSLLLFPVFPLIALASAFDYPLRVPILMMSFVLAICLLADRSGLSHDLPPRADRH